MAEQGATRSQDVDEAQAAHKVALARIDYLKAQIVQTFANNKKQLRIRFTYNSRQEANAFECSSGTGG